MKNWLKYIYIIIFMVISLAPLGLFVFSHAVGSNEDLNFDKAEIREFPGIFDESGINKSFNDECEEWLNQNIPYRKNLITGINEIMSGLLGEPSSNVIIGTEGWIYSQETTDDYMNTNAMSENELRSISVSLSLIQERVLRRGGNFLFVPVPNKNSIYPEYMPERYMKADINNLDRLYKILDGNEVRYANLKEALIQRKASGDTGRLYYKRDTHWTLFGAVTGYESIMEGLGRTPIECDIQDYCTVYDRQGDLDKLLYPAEIRTEEEYVANEQIDCDSFEFTYPMDVNDTRAQLENYMSDREDHDNNFTTTKFETTDNSSLYMIRDSFGRALLPYMINSYDEATFIRSTAPSFENVSNTSDVVYEICERNLGRLIKTAPFMYAPEREKTDEEMQEYVSSLNTCFYEDEGYAYRVYGTVDSQMVGEDGRIYARLYSDSEVRLFEAFPIIEEDMLAEKCPETVRTAKDGIYGYSLYIGKGVIDQCDYSVKVVSGDKETDVLALIAVQNDGDSSEDALVDVNNPYEKENSDHELVYRGVTIGIGDNMNSLKKALGDQAAPSEIVSSCLSGKDAILYYYPNITIETDMNGEIYYISLMDNSYSDGKANAVTAKGITIGSDKKDIWEKLGKTTKENDKNCTYKTAHLKVTYSYKNEKVTAVILEDGKYSADDSDEEEEQSLPGAEYAGGNTYLYDDEHMMQKGWQVIDDQYYFFDRLTGERIVGQTVDGIAIGEDGSVNLTEYEKNKIETMIMAHKVIDEITLPTDSMEEKRRKAFDWIMSFPYHRYRRIGEVYKEEGIEITEANDIFEAGAGDCVSESAALAFLFHEIGYNNVYWVHDTGHSWVRSDDRLYDPLFAESRNFEANYDAPFTDYRATMVHSMLIY